MKRLLSLIVCMMSLSFISAFAGNWNVFDFAHYGRYAEANAQLGAPRNGEHRVVLMGDSITDGWPGIRPDFFTENEIIGRGISGETSYQFLLRFQNDVIDLKPTLVVINYGTNDIAENTGAYNEAQTFRNVKAMCEMAMGSGITVVLASTLPHGSFGWNPSVTDVMAKVRSLNVLVKAYAEEKGITYVDYFSSMVSQDGTRMREELSKDGVHPNADGYKIMEDLLLPVISKMR
ncbi:MAG: lipase [Alistipes sp.]|nr:lipase [Candidatus Minthomonas equi]